MLLRWIAMLALFAHLNIGFAMQLTPMSLDDLVRQSPRILSARCVGIEIRELPQYGNNIFTFYRFEPLEVLHGNLRKPFEIRLFGGQLGNTVVDGDGMPRFTRGESYLMFLGADNADGYPLIKPQGLFRLDPAASGRAAQIAEPLADGNAVRSLNVEAVAKRVAELLDAAGASPPGR